MSSNKSQNVLDFYYRMNQKKYEIVDDSNERPVSYAEKVFRECVLALGVESQYNTDCNVGKIIKLLLSKSIGRDNIKLLTKADKYNRLVDAYNSQSCVDAWEASFCLRYFLFDDKSKKIFSNDPKIYELLDNFEKLRTKIRQGHIYWGAKGERLESVSEHTYGACMLAIGIDSEYDISDFNMNKLLEMLILHETEEIIIGDQTEWDGMTPEEKLIEGRKAVINILGSLKRGNEYIRLLDEFNARKTKEASYAYLCDKMEYDLQVKAYEKMGKYDFENRPSNVVTRSKSVNDIINSGAESVFDVHYEYDKPRYTENEPFKLLLEEVKRK